MSSLWRRTVDLLESVDESAEVRFNRGRQDIENVNASVASHDRATPASEGAGRRGIEPQHHAFSSSAAAGETHYGDDASSPSYVNALRREIKELNQEIEKLHSDKDGLKRQLEDARQREESLTAQVQDAYTDLQNERKRRMDSSSDGTSVSNQYQNLALQYEELQSQYEELQLQFERTRKEYDQALRQTRDQLEHKEQTLSSTLSDLRHLKKQNEQKVKDLSEENDSLTTSLIAAQKRVEELESRTTELNEDTQETDRSSTADALEESLKSSHKRISSLNEELNQAYQRIESLRNENGKLSSEIRELSEQVQRLTRERDELARQAKEEKNENQSLERYQTQINQLTKQLSAKQEKIDSLSSQLSVLHVQLQREIKARENVEQAGSPNHRFDAEDVESASGGSLRFRNTQNPTSYEQQRKRNHLTARVPLSNIRSISRYQGVARFADILDRWFGESAYILAVNPMVRLVFFFYLVCLHAMCFFILAFHSHELSHDDELASSTKTNFPSSLGASGDG
eukprot:gb/GECG01006838.1/.p1 GENE.gb/GECG01006838.1/~~gb/GECG01006838.1/.p1  ORF type:complete len:515 (+),score=98.52 gb/GECG01006838.1/:1-1545(+)